jgi:hypothetical protein
MSVLQVKRFVDESIAGDKKWGRIRVLGGEPLIHPNALDIIDILLEYRNKYSPYTKIEVTTNGYGPEVAGRLEKIPCDISVNNTKKTGKYQKKFEAFNEAPVDQWHYFLTDYINCCWITQDCGIGLNRYGYYQCAVAGSIDRVLGFDIGSKKLPVNASEFSRQKRILCKYCGHFIRRKFVPVDQRIEVKGEPRSKSWIKAYRRYDEEKPSLNLY